MFYWILNMSILGTLTGFVVLIIRKIKRLPRFVPYVLWLVPCVRFLIPFGIGSAFSLMNVISKLTTKTIVIYEETSILPAFSMTNSIMAAEDYFPIVYKTNLLENVFSVASVIWAVFAAAALIASVSLYFITKAEFKNAELISKNVYASDKILSPAVYGVFKPRIILPKGLLDDDIPFILQHENIHIHRGDNLWRVIAVVTACIHWFNPFIWLLLKCFFADMELSCDEKVLKKYGVEKRREYATVLVNCESNKTMFASAFGGAKTRVRIENILSYKRFTAFSSVCFLVLIIVITVVLLTNTVV